MTGYKYSSLGNDWQATCPITKVFLCYFLSGQGQASPAGGLLQRRESTAVYAEPMKPQQRYFRREEHIYNDTTAPDLPPRGYYDGHKCTIHWSVMQCMCI